MKVLLVAVTLATVWLVAHGFQGTSRARTNMNLGVMKKNMVDTHRSSEIRVNPYGEGSNSGKEPRKTGLKKTPLSQRSGARPLTRVERKAKELYEGQLNDVERVHSPASRVPLSELTIGQKLRGRIISVKDFGLFVDVGSKRDGLVHIKDVSKDYFISQLETKFVPGQDVDVWVKFCEPKSYKLGLQMFPVTRTTKARSQATLLSSKSHREALALPSNLPEEEAEALATQLADGELDEAFALSNDSGNDSNDSDIFLTSLEAFDIGDEVEGKVVRMSNFGVFVEFGAEVVGFLHKRKMAVSPKRRALKPWEINPIGSTITAYVVEVDLDRRRINLSTYTPDRWVDMLPSAPAMMRTDEGKYLPVSGSAAYSSSNGNMPVLGSYDDDDFSKEALERQLALSLGEEEDDDEEHENDLLLGDEEDEDDDDDDEDGFGLDDDKAFDTRGEDLSAAEVRALMQASNRERSKLGDATNAKIVIDDLGSAMGSGSVGEKKKEGGAEVREFDRRDRSPESIKAFQAALAAEREMNQAMDEGEELLTEEIFAELCPRGRSVVTVKEVKKWDYVKDLLSDGDLTEDTLSELVVAVSGEESGKLTLEDFDNFIDLLAERLGLEEVGSHTDTAEYYLGGGTPTASSGGGTTDSGIGDNTKDDEDNTEPGSMVFEVLPDVPQEGDIEGLEDLPTSDFELVEDDEEEKEGEGGMAIIGDEDEFVFTVETISSPVAALAASEANKEEEEDEDFDIDLSIRDDDDLFGSEETGAGVGAGAGAGLEGLVRSAPDAKPSKVKGQDILKYVFDSVSSGHPQGVSLDNCLEWDFVKALLNPNPSSSSSGGGKVTRVEVVEAFHDCVATSSSGAAKDAGNLDLPAFNEYMGCLTDLEGRHKDAANQELISSSFVETGEDEDLLELDLEVPLPVGGTTDTLLQQYSSITDANEGADADAVSVSVDGISAAFEDDEDDDWEQEDGEDDEEDDEMSIEEAFEALSEGKKTVTMAQIQDWDVIDELFSAGVLDEGELGDLFNRAGAKGRNTLTLDGFETLLDLLSPLTDDIEEDEDSVLEGLQRVSDTPGTSPVSSGAGGDDENEGRMSVSSGSGSGITTTASGDEEEEEVDEEALLVSVFQSLAHGKPRATVKDLLSWDFVLELMGEGLLTEELLADKMTGAGGTAKGIEVEHFDAFVNSLVDLYGEESESEEEAREFDSLVSTAKVTPTASLGEEGRSVLEGGDDDDYEADLDIGEAFQELAGSDKEGVTITSTQLLGWELLQEVSDTHE